MLIHIHRQAGFEVPVFGWQWQGFQLKVNAMSSFMGLFHLQLVHETDLPSGADDLALVENGIQVFRAYNQKMEEIAKLIRELVKDKCKASRKRKANAVNPSMQSSVSPVPNELTVVSTPLGPKKRHVHEHVDDECDSPSFD